MANEPRIHKSTVRFFPKIQLESEIDPKKSAIESILVPDAPKDFTDVEYDPPSQEFVFTQGDLPFGKGMTKSVAIVRPCSICQEPLVGYGNNARPINNGRCCKKCDDDVVIPARVRRLDQGLKSYEGGLDEDRVTSMAKEALGDAVNEEALNKQLGTSISSLLGNQVNLDDKPESGRYTRRIPH